MASWFKILGRPVGRQAFIMSAICGLYPIISVFGRARLQPDPLYVLTLILAIIFVPIWISATCGRLRDLKLSAWLVLVYALPWGAFIWTLVHREIAFFIAFAVLIAAELPLALIPGRISRGEDDRAEIA
jgi:uncharacterized membrane protein YhaH (DUF805 family)